MRETHDEPVVLFVMRKVQTVVPIDVTWDPDVMGSGTGNLTAALTSFVGRRSMLRMVKSVMSASRLVTLTGAGGVGKTRLARQAGHELRRTFRDGAWLVELADVHDGSLVTTSIADAIGCRGKTPDPLDSLMDYLEDQELLLILDNCEHLVESCAVAASKLLAACPQARILATSRHVLGAMGEHVIPVEPLDYESGPGEPNEALELLRDRAVAADPEFQLTDANRDAALMICRRLGGIPLALELVAARLRTFTPAEIIDHLSNSDFLSSDEPTRTERHRTLESAIDWSYELCSPAEQHLWQQLSVFSGGFTLDAACQVCDVSTSDESLLHLIAGLVDKSVLTRVRRSHGKHSRYTMLEPIRQFAQMRLAAGTGEDDLRRRHRDYFRALAGRANADYCSERDVEWFATARQEHANIRLALEFSVSEPGGTPVAMDMAADLRPFWEHCGSVHEGYTWLRRALANRDSPARNRARALAAASELALLFEDLESAQEFLSEYRDLVREIPDFEAQALLVESLVAFSSGDLAAALTAAEKSAELGLKLHDDGVAAEGLAAASVFAFVAGDERAQSIAERFLGHVEQTTLLKAIALWILGLNHLRSTDPSTAREALRSALILLREFDEIDLVAICFEGIAWLEASSGDSAHAAVLLGASKNRWRLSQMRLPEAMTQRVGTAIENGLREELGAATFDRLVGTGAGYSHHEAISYALREKPSERISSARPAQPAGLTRREMQIATLVARGLTNKEIARELVVSHRTVDAHVDHILSKLGFRSRVQVASWISELKPER